MQWANKQPVVASPLYRETPVMSLVEDCGVGWPELGQSVRKGQQ